MADTTLNKIVDLIRAGNPEMRQAALRVAGAVGSTKDSGLVRTLLDVLSGSDPELRLLAIDALGSVGAEEALDPLIELVHAGGPELEAAARAAGRLGKRGVKALGKAQADAPTHLRRRIAEALGHAGGAAALAGAVQALLDPEPSVVEAASRSLAAELPKLTDKDRRALVEQLLDIIQAKPRTRLAPASETAILRILGGLHPARAEEVFWSCLEPSRPASLRSAALQALGSLPLPTTDAKVKRLLECAADGDFQVVAPALLILQKVPSGRKNVKQWLGLLEARDVAARKLAVDKLREVDTPEVATALLGQLRHPDRGLQQSALAVLRQSEAGRDALLEALHEAATPDEAWSLARAQKDAASGHTAAQGKKLFAQACRYQDADDRRADALWFLLRESDPEGTRDQIEQKALALRKKKDYARALGYWRLLTRDPACGSQIRFEQAATGLKLSDHDC